MRCLACFRDRLLFGGKAHPDRARRRKRDGAQGEPRGIGGGAKVHDDQASDTCDGHAGSDAGVEHARELRAAQLREPLERPRGHQHQHPAARDAGQRAQNEPEDEPVDEAHRDGRQADGQQRRADCEREVYVQPDRRQGAGEVAKVVGGGEPAALGERQALFLHQRQDRRHRETADPLRDGKGGESGERGGQSGELPPQSPLASAMRRFKSR